MTNKTFFTADGLRVIAAAGILAFGGFTLIAPAKAHDINIVINEETDLLDQLIAMDADDIAAMKSEFAEARIEIVEAVAEARQARDAVDENAFARAIAAVAFRVASEAVGEAGEEAIGEVLVELTKAEEELEMRRTELGEAEYEETRGAIAVLRTELGAIGALLAELAGALKNG